MLGPRGDGGCIDAVCREGGSEQMLNTDRWTYEDY
jgi:hypothetical protein